MSGYGTVRVGFFHAMHHMQISPILTNLKYFRQLIKANT